MRHIIYILAILFTTAVIISCSSAEKSEEQSSIDILTDQVDDSAPTDSAIYLMGSEAAADMLNTCTTETELQEALLDTKARIHVISTHVGVSAATDYTKGFVHYIKTNDESLAAKLF